MPVHVRGDGRGAGGVLFHQRVRPACGRLLLCPPLVPCPGIRRHARTHAPALRTHAPTPLAVSPAYHTHVLCFTHARTHTHTHALVRTRISVGARWRFERACEVATCGVQTRRGANMRCAPRRSKCVRAVALHALGKWSRTTAVAFPWGWRRRGTCCTRPWGSAPNTCGPSPCWQVARAPPSPAPTRASS